jgi:hypothetical protein
MDAECRLCLLKTERDESVNIFAPGKNKELLINLMLCISSHFNGNWRINDSCDNSLNLPHFKWIVAKY